MPIEPAQPSTPASPRPGEMAALVRSHDWSKTPLGPVENWSPSLRLIVNIMMAAGFPKAVRWGPEFVLIYNDGYKPFLGDKHPKALGLPTAPSADAAILTRPHRGEITVRRPRRGIALAGDLLRLHDALVARRQAALFIALAVAAGKLRAPP